MIKEIIELDKVKNNAWNLVGGVYREVARNSKYKILTINQFFNQELITLKKGKTITKAKIEKGNIPVIAGGRTSPYTHSKYTNEGNVITMSASGAHAGYIWYHDYPIWASDCNVLYSNNETIVLTKYLYYVLHAQQQEIYKLQHGAGQPHIYGNDLKNIKIPLPSIEQQQQIVDELDSYQKIIDGAKKVVDNWNLIGKLHREVIRNDKCKMVKLDEICKIESGNAAPQDKKLFEHGIFPFFRVSDIAKYHITDNLLKSKDKLNHDGTKGLKLFKKNSILIPKSGASCLLKHQAIMGCDGYVVSHLAIISPNEEKALSKFIFYMFYNINVESLIFNDSYPSIKIESLQNLLIPLPPIEEQQKIVEQLDNEHKMIESQKEIISYFEAKVHDRLNSIWEQDVKRQWK